MILFIRRPDGIHLTLTVGERSVLESLTTQFVDILTTAIGDDPVELRLFPSAYPGDQEAADEFRRYTYDDLHAQKLENARTVLAWLTGAVTGPFDAAAEQAWLRCLTDLRLTVAERLGITTEHPDGDLGGHPDDDDDDGRVFGLRDVYEWLGSVQEQLVATLMSRGSEHPAR